MLLATLGASLLGSLSKDKEIIQIGEGTVRASKGTIKREQGF